MPTAGPTDVLDYTIDWDPRLQATETIVTSTWTVPTGITQATPPPSFTNDSTTIWLTGGEVGRQYQVVNQITTSQGRTYTQSFWLTVIDESVPAADPYCSVAQVRAAGGVGTDEQIVEAIRDAMARVDDFTHDRFSPRPLTVTAQIQPDGRAFLPYRLTGVGGVTSVVSGAVSYPSSTWQAYSSADPGDVDAIGLGRDHAGTNILVNGLEPWAERSPYGGVIRVTAMFGWGVTPVSVQMATAHLAAIISRAVRQDDDNDPATPPPQTSTTVDPEGNVLPVVPPFATDDDQVAYDPAVADRTTGSRQADALLLPYRRTPVLTGV